jgi:hypothetical protein
MDQDFPGLLKQTAAIEQGAAKSLLQRFVGSVPALRFAATEKASARTSTQNRKKVVHGNRQRSGVAKHSNDPADGLEKKSVTSRESFRNIRTRLDKFGHAVVLKVNQGIHMPRQFRQRFSSLLRSAPAFELEWRSDNAHHESPLLLGHFGQ